MKHMTIIGIALATGVAYTWQAHRLFGSDSDPILHAAMSVLRGWLS